jgi:nucleoside-diphosphate-sugar epimerase
MSRVAVIGAAGYLGLRLVNRLQQGGHEVLAVCRANGRFLLSRHDVDVWGPHETRKCKKADVVINLAYPTDGISYDRAKKVEDILQLISTVATDNATIIHTSTQAVFGYNLERPVKLSDINFKRDYEYVENKIRLERDFIRKFSRQKRIVVRLGNLWGPASPAWTVKLIERVRVGKPVSMEGVDGFSNVTDVENASDYLAFLVKYPPEATLTYYHLAEHSGQPWSYWLGHISDALQLPLVGVKGCPTYSKGLKDDFLDALSGVRVSGSLVKLWHGRVTGSILRSALPLLPEFLRHRFSRFGSEIILSEPSTVIDDPVFMTLLGCPRQFQSVVAPNWRCPRSSIESWRRVEQWMKEVGYIE